ncbi:unnamed protein product (macronuclear) [Paramecium tetraurelia]|uniref:Chromosome undetermined scaffold_174, whole genome shotgun sequence n=1 Tax=Paramecium tetraurelia TaxID=5888 RepID=Q3SD82_PARTE|nr:uncharacterized protein GSPATT00037899001 [Paramecium tetraurelia]CAI44483.1 rab_C72 [Paramecium tetraurelia]CAK69460.1 unnamed protein product [Paramecium tetraurelia]|eukprot:XP_001436857.1 hypothetical protein (macronuclear) [Paramecium tetraurelia strain d4-2]
MTRCNENEYDFLFKIILIGDSGVGKTNILQRFVKNEFILDSKPTIGVEFSTKTINVENKSVKCQIWDTAGQERYRAITNAYYRGAVGAFVCYDITREITFTNIEKWLSEIKEYAPKNIVIMMIGNKIDQANDRMVRSVEAAKLCQQNKIGYIETSAQNGLNVEEAFSNLVSEIFSSMSSKQQKNVKQLQGDNLTLDDDLPSKSITKKTNCRKEKENCCQ